MKNNDSLPKKNGDDFTDFIVKHGRTKSDFLELPTFEYEAPEERKYSKPPWINQKRNTDLPSLQEVHDRANSLTEAAEKDPRSAFRIDNIKFLSDIRAAFPDVYSATREKLKAAKVGVMQLDKAVDGVNGNSDGAKNNPKHSDAAQILAPQFQGLFQYDLISKNWFKYQNDYWKIIAPEKFSAVITGAIRNDNENFHFGFNMSYRDGIIGLLKDELQCDFRQKEIHLIPFENVVLNPKTLEQMPHDPSLFLTYKVPYPYNPEATCQPIVRWLNEALGGNDDLVQLLRAFMVIVLLGMANEAQRFIELVGPGGTGKSTFLWLLMQLAGAENTLTTELRVLETSRFETANIYNKRLVLITDAERYNGSISTLKAITGGDTIRYEEKYRQASHGYQPNTPVAIAANETIQTAEYTSGLRRRRVTIFFRNKVPTEKQRDLKAEFAPLIPGLMNWVLGLKVEEAIRILKSPGSQAQLADSKESLLETNGIASWLHENIVYSPANRLFVGNATRVRDEEEVTRYRNEDKWLYPNYVKHCETHGIKAIAHTRFTKLLEDLCQNQLGLMDVKSLPKGRFGRPFIGLDFRSVNDELALSPVDQGLGIKKGVA